MARLFSKKEGLKETFTEGGTGPGVLRPRLVGKDGREYGLGREVFVIGREGENRLKVPVDLALRSAGVSDPHCYIFECEMRDGYFVVDAKSKHGTEIRRNIGGKSFIDRVERAVAEPDHYGSVERKEDADRIKSLMMKQRSLDINPTKIIGGICYWLLKYQGVRDAFVDRGYASAIEEGDEIRLLRNFEGGKYDAVVYIR